MNEASNAQQRPLRVARWAIYACKALAAFAVVWGVGAMAEFAPPTILAIAWALLSCASAIAAAYPYVIKRINTAGMFQPDSMVFRRINGRFFLFVLCFVVSAALMASLVLDMQRWGMREWTVAIISIPLYLVVSSLVARASGTQYKEAFQDRGTMLWSLWTTGILLSLVYLLVMFLAPSAGHASLGETFAATRQLFADSPSALVSETGKWEYVVQCLTSFGVDQAVKAPFVVYLAVSAVTCVLTSFAIAHLLNFCSLGIRQFRQVFMPLGELEHDAKHARVMKSSIAALAIMSIAMICGFVALDAKTTELTETPEYASFEETVRAQTDLTAYQVNGKNFAAKTVDNAMEDVLGNDEEASQALQALVQKVNDAYDRCENKVDEYLDWYYNFFTGFERAFERLGGTEESLLRKEYLSRIGSALNEEDLEPDIEAYNATRQSLRERVESELSSSSQYGIPDWLVANVRTLDEFPQFQQLEGIDDLSELAEPEGEYDNPHVKREVYRQAIMDAIEKSRSEALALIE